MRRDGAGNGLLHPALSSMFRVTDGLRMVMHQMLFIPVGEPTLSPDAPMTVDEILDYVERNHSFHSDYGVCAGPRVMVREFLQVLIEGRARAGPSSVALEPSVRAALDNLEPALDYALYGLRAYAAVFSLWPAMTRAYERIAAIAKNAPESGDQFIAILRERMQAHLESVRQRTLLGSEEWRVDRERVYADMYDQCGRALPGERGAPGLTERLSALSEPAQEDLVVVLTRHFQAAHASFVRELSDAIMDFLVRTRAVLRVANDAQDAINRVLKRDRPARLFTAADIDIHNLLLGVESRRLPYLIDELQALFEIAIAVDPNTISISGRFTA